MACPAASRPRSARRVFDRRAALRIELRGLQTLPSAEIMKIPTITKCLGMLLAVASACALAQQPAQSSGDKPGEKAGGLPRFQSMCVGCHGIPYYQTAF